jgi:hypothetical protein
VAAGYNRLKYALMAGAFILTTPLGVAIGLGISSSFNPNSKAALSSEGAFNSISAGEAPASPLSLLIVQQTHKTGSTTVQLRDYGLGKGPLLE